MHIIIKFFVFIYIIIREYTYKFICDFNNRYEEYSNISRNIFLHKHRLSVLEKVSIYYELFKINFFKKYILEILSTPLTNLKKQLDPYNKTIIILFGNNGVGKTTTMNNLAKYFEEKNIESIKFSCDFFTHCSSHNFNKNKFIQLNSKNCKKNFNNILLYVNNYFESKIFLIDTTGVNHNDGNFKKQLKSFTYHINLARKDFNVIKIHVIDALESNEEQMISFNSIVDIDGYIITKTDLKNMYNPLVNIYFTTKKPIYFINDMNSKSGIYKPSQFNIMSEFNHMFQEINDIYTPK